ncbi:MAG: hypothetical protein MJZ60_09680 [Bacteroidaceae bacterium]|nr:hypothetical protein [Bacteroidaceae bacterium]
MKKKLLLMSAVSLSWLGASAQWVMPKAPQSSSPEEIAAAGTKVKLLNVEQGGFLTGSNAWGTKSSLTATGCHWIIERSDDGANFKLKNVDGPKSGSYLFRDNASGCFVDMGNQNRGFNWTFTKTENGYYTIKSPQDDLVYGEESYENWQHEFFGWNSTVIEDDKVPNVVLANISDIPEENVDEEGELVDFGIEWSIVTDEAVAEYSEAVKPYNAAMDLKAAIEKAQDEYPNINLDEQLKVYNNTNSTVEELEAAKKSIANAIGAMRSQEVLEGATEGDPKDGTELIENADFSAGNISGWVCTFKSGSTATNVGYQGAAYPKDGVAPTLWEDPETGETGESRISQFIEAWANNVNEMKREDRSFATVGDAKLCQTIYGLPAGKYKLSCDAIAVQQWDASQNPVSGVQLYVIGGDIDSHEEIASANEVPNHTILTFIHTGGDVELGLRTKSATANWISADNFKLVYYGPISKNPYEILLEDYVASTEKKYGDMDGVRANAQTKAALTGALEKASNMENGKDDAYYQDLKSELEAAVKALETSVAAYETLNKAIETTTEKKAQIEETWADLAGEISDAINDWKESYENGTFDNEGAISVADQLSNMIANYISKNCKAGDDVTILLDNPGFTKDFSGWTMGGAGVVWQDNYGNGENIAEAAANIEAPSREDGLAERWHAKFTMTQTIKNMPRGLYTLSCQGFNRHDDDENNAAAELYAVLPDGSIQTAPFASIEDYATDEILFDNTAGENVAPTDHWRSDSERDGKFVPNSMTGAAWHFMNKLDGENYDYVSKFNIVLTEQGDLTVGARCEYEHQWVIFDNFRIIYQGNGPEVYAMPIADKIKEGDKILESYESESEPYAALGLTTDMVNAWGDLAKRAQAIVDNPSSADEETCLAMLKEFDQMFKDMRASGDAILNLKKKVDYVNGYRLDEVGESNALVDCLETIEEAYLSNEIESVEAINKYIEQIDALCSLAAIENAEGDIASATEEEPVDVSKAIDNRSAIDLTDSTKGSTFAWNKTGNVGTYYAQVDGEDNPRSAFEVYNQESFEVSQVIALVPGYYRLKVQGFHRNGWSENIAKCLSGTVDEKEVDKVDAEGNVVLDEEGNPVKETQKITYTNDANAILFVGDAQTPLKTIAADLEAYNAIEGVAGQAWPVNGVSSKFPNNMADACNAFANGLYENILQFQVSASDAKKVAPIAGAGEKAVKVGIKNVGHKDGDWTIYTNFRLEYLGTKEPANDLTTTAIAEITNNNAARVIFDLTGRQVSKVAKGIYIVNGKKVVVK